MDSWFEGQLTAYPEDAPTLGPLHLGSGIPRSKHVASASIRMRRRRHFGAPITGSGGGRQRGRQGVTGGSPDEDILLVVSNLPGSRTCLGEQGRGTHD